MRTTIDAAGRVVIPKKIREATHLEAGAEIEVRVVAGAVQIEPIGSPVRLEKRGSFVVAMPSAAQPPLTSEVVRRIQEEVRGERGTVARRNVRKRSG